MFRTSIPRIVVSLWMPHTMKSMIGHVTNHEAMREKGRSFPFPIRSAPFPLAAIAYRMVSTIGR
eukprot:CAMPEP_0196729536 /NCGR_PEP_ID=MMETSP1091-20130531/9907_1 /TAXON_ID=302021 /ORGANISM="Rhodomonas sp., Strain CCMP768" /LENGTH=63 /DNA_ID=CAMNT_0042072437 /DNA_START=29 /DNA_END=220 /DNA_ORIENTATION=-